EAQGRVVAHLTIGTDGRVSACSVTTSSGNSDLDDATCRISKSRVRFTPAKDANGSPIESSYTLPVRWVLPSE
ncbi:MAG: energy transducer TonB, partial [Pseudomonadota bacterium]|nr:energy transducer TonB [Pseudomonadota bacterium]